MTRSITPLASISTKSKNKWLTSSDLVMNLPVQVMWCWVLYGDLFQLIVVDFLECGECFPQSELMFQHMSVDHSLLNDATLLLRHERSVDSGVFPDLETDDLLGYSFDHSPQ